MDVLGQDGLMETVPCGVDSPSEAHGERRVPKGTKHGVNLSLSRLVLFLGLKHVVQAGVRRAFFILVAVGSKPPAMQKRCG